MEPALVGGLGFIFMILMIALGMPIAFAMGLTGVFGFWALKGWPAMTGVLMTLPLNSVSHFTYVAVPMFILMGEFSLYAGFVKDLFAAGYKWLGKLPGGLALGAIAANAGFGAVSGSSLSAAAIMGKMCVPEMRKRGYDPRLATGVIAASGTLAMLIPPSILAVLYALFAQVSAGKVLVAGILPGILTAVMYGLAVLVFVRRVPGSAPRLLDSITWGDRLSSLTRIWPMLMLFGLVMGGIYLGWVTPTEGAGIGASGALLLALARRQMSWSGFRGSVGSAIKTTSMVFLIVMGASMMTTFEAASGFPRTATAWLVALDVPPMVVIVGMLLIYMVMGCFIDTLGMLLLTFPVFFPAIEAFGFDKILWGILFIKVAEVGLMTPPVGMNVYIVKSVVPDVKLDDIFRGVGWFIAFDFVTIALLLAFPEITLWLPSMMK